jgi:hypothetical protein
MCVRSQRGQAGDACIDALEALTGVVRAFIGIPNPAVARRPMRVTCSRRPAVVMGAGVGEHARNHQFRTLRRMAFHTSPHVTHRQYDSAVTTLLVVFMSTERQAGHADGGGMRSLGSLPADLCISRITDLLIRNGNPDTWAVAFDQYRRTHRMLRNSLLTLPAAVLTR